MNINEKKWIDRGWPSTEYYGIEDSGVLCKIGTYDCWDDMEEDINLDKFVWVWTHDSFVQFLSYGVMLLGRNNE